MEIGDLYIKTDSAPEKDSGLSRAAAARFAEKWKSATDEKQESSTFWHSFFIDFLGITDLQAAGIEFEKRVISSKKGTTNYIDVFWKDTFLVEQKSGGKDLEAAEVQARDYLVSLPPALRPPIVIVSDFARFRIVDVLLNKSFEFRLESLPEQLDRFEAIISHKTKQVTNVQVEADQKAAQLMADLYIQLEKYGYEGHEASVFMVRILFCLFADDTRMWKTDIFHRLVQDTNPLGTDLGPRLSNLFALLDTPKEMRRGPEDPLLADFPYVNGGIFSERLATVNFNGAMRNALMNACMYDWSSINPTIFGALFQDIKSKDERHANGEHYTTEVNIDKTIKPLFIDELHKKLEASWDSDGKLKELQRELGTYQILDPACGCGNFLITTYKRLRQLELEIIIRLKQLDGTTGYTSLFDVAEDLCVKLEQLHGIEYVEWSSQIAKVAIYLTDHQENMKLETVLGVAANRFPLSHSANIVQGNALQIDWESVCPMTEKTIIVGNPPFLGARLQTPEQKSDQAEIWGGIPGSGMTDYVTNWFILASRHIMRSGCRAALVSTNSITQGDQPALLWSVLNQSNVEISFAHKTFAWENDASGKAAVHCVIIGLGRRGLRKSKQLWDYSEASDAPKMSVAKNINAYLVDGADILVSARKTPMVSWVPPLLTGNEPRDGGFLSNISPAEAEKIKAEDPIAAKYLRVLIGSQEVLNGVGNRFCLWLVDAQPSDLKASKELSSRVLAVRENRLKTVGTKSAKAKTADTPTLFSRIAQPKVRFMAVPSVSSEKRKYIPLEIFEPDVIVNNAVFFIESNDLALYSILQSKVFRIWVEAVSSRMKSDYQISASSVYNTFPFPELNAETRASLEALGHELAQERAKFPSTALGDLYDPLLMPPGVLSVHKKIDSTLLRALGLKPTSSDSEILKQEFSLFAEISGRQ